MVTIIQIIDLVSLLVVLTAELNLQHSNFKIASGLKLSGDAELNPGPYESRQCACNALFLICWSVVCDTCNWKSVNLDYILVEGDKLYKSLYIEVL